MLIAQEGEARINAEEAARGRSYHCPQCGETVVLKQGRKVIYHFAHKAKTECSWANGETKEHREAKKLVAHALTARGLRTEIEFILESMSGDRRADVMTWSPKNQQVAFELQHTPIDPKTIEERAFSYAKANVAQIWIPFLRSTVWTSGEKTTNGWFVRRYSPRLFERWVYGLNKNDGMWMYDPAKKEFWHAVLTEHKLYVPESSWFSECGDELSGGGYYRPSKRFMELNLTGPHKIEDLRIKIDHRMAAKSDVFHWPAAPFANLIAQ